MTTTIPEELKTGTHRVNFAVVFRGKHTVNRIDARFTFKRFNSKLRVICHNEGRQIEDVKRVEVKKINL